jgi:hypothetical protein
MANQLKTIKYNLTQTHGSDKTFPNESSEHIMSLTEYYSHCFDNSIKLSNLKPNNYYYIIVNKTDTTSEITSIAQSNNKVLKIFIKKINKNIVTINETKNIIFENYIWYYFYPNIKTDQSYILFQTFNNSFISNEIIKYLLNIDTIHAQKIMDYYWVANFKSNLISLGTVIPSIQSYWDDLNILKLNTYSDSFFEYITKKYSSDNNKTFEILAILADNYNYPLKSNRHELDNVFDYILYISLYNYKIVFVNNKIQSYSHYNSCELLHPNINSILPIKLKNLYSNLLKAMSQMINNDFDCITYNQKFYTDYLHKNIIKLFFANTSSLTINLFKGLLKHSDFDKFKNIVSINMLLIDIGAKLTWNTLPKKLTYLNVFYKNNNIVYYQDKLNKNIIPENFDSRIKKVIENPFEMYKYLRKEKDFVKWTKFISDKIIQLYLIPISLSTDDFTHIGELIYLLFNITDQNIKEPSYVNFINFCNAHSKLVLDANRINLKVRDYFPTLKTNINLGFLAKHLTWDKEIITFEDPKIEKTPDILNLEMKLHVTTKKYYKYKAKYLGSKNVVASKNWISDTSSIMPINKN